MNEEKTKTEQKKPVEPVSPKKQTAEEMEQEFKKLEIELKRLELQDAQERLDERRLKRDNKQELSKTNGRTLAQNNANDEAQQARCTHRKGGEGAAAILNGQGQDAQHAVLKHQFANGDMWVRCLRCGKTWKPAVREQCRNDEEYLKLTAEYHAAVNFQTLNKPSSAMQFRFSDGGESYRKAMANTNLR